MPGKAISSRAAMRSAIASGAHDAHITDWATRLADWGSPVMLRFGHEMNGNWYPWAEGVNGNGAGDYVAAWRHVHDIFTRAGADNVQWVWNPNVPYYGSTPLDGLYPGADYVDVVALDVVSDDNAVRVHLSYLLRATGARTDDVFEGRAA